tara:strand:- start:40 stop:480 length:441 start_codon:yes stop_codon:yes gene_type:complete
MALLGGGYTYAMPIIGGWVGNITSTYGSWASYNTTYYRWAVPAAGTYELVASLRVRAWGSTGFTKFRILRASDSSALGGSDFVKMGFEQNNNATEINCQIHQIWIASCSAADSFYLQGQAMVTDSANHSLQSDANGRPELFWRRVN